MMNISFLRAPAITMRVWLALFGLAMASSSMTSANAASPSTGPPQATARARPTRRPLRSTSPFQAQHGPHRDVDQSRHLQTNDPPDILTGVFFTIPGDPTLTKLSA